MKKKAKHLFPWFWYCSKSWVHTVDGAPAQMPFVFSFTFDIHIVHYVMPSEGWSAPQFALQPAYQFWWSILIKSKYLYCSNFILDRLWISFVLDFSSKVQVELPSGSGSAIVRNTVHFFFIPKQHAHSVSICHPGHHVSKFSFFVMTLSLNFQMNSQQSCPSAAPSLFSL